MHKFNIVKRDAMPLIRSIDKDGVEHGLGEFRDFRWSDPLREFLPHMEEFSMSWASLAHREVLKAHTHPIQSMMVIYKGEGAVFGDLNRPLREGDVLVVPPGCSHGFVGGPPGLYAVTVQLGQGFYTVRDQQPRVAFIELEPSLKVLFQNNETRCAEFTKGNLFGLLVDGTLRNPDKRSALLDHVDVWLASVECMLASRRGLIRNPRYLARYSGPRGRFSPSRTPNAVLSAMAGWFDYQMFVLDDPERAAVVHLVVERALTTYFESARSVQSQRPAEPLDGHDPEQSLPEVAMQTVLRKESTRTYDRLQNVIDEAWDMIGSLTDHLADLVRRA